MPVAAPPSIGFYTWLVPMNALYGDAIFAKLYGIAPEVVSAGVDVEVILGKIIEEDRHRIAGNVRKAILTGELSSGSYRILLPDGKLRTLTSFGRCFRNESGDASFYSGAVIDTPASGQALGNDTLVALCQAALSLAEQRGNELTARYLLSALKSVGPGSHSTSEDG